MIVATSAAVPASRKVAQAHCPKRASGSPTSPYTASRHSMATSQPTGSTKPSSTGAAHSVTASAARRPRSTTGRASPDCAEPERLDEKRMRDCARRSSASSSATSASRMEASCAAATGSFIDSQAR